MLKKKLLKISRKYLFETPNRRHFWSIERITFGTLPLPEKSFRLEKRKKKKEKITSHGKTYTRSSFRPDRTTGALPGGGEGMVATQTRQRGSNLSSPRLTVCPWQVARNRGGRVDATCSRPGPRRVISFSQNAIIVFTDRGSRERP